MPKRVRVTRSLVDREHGWALPAWQEMGSPDWPTSAQLDSLHEAAAPEVRMRSESLDGGLLVIRETISPLGMLLIEVEVV